MSSWRSAKRTKIGRSTYHDTIPIFNDYDVIHSSEGIAQNVRGKTQYIRRHEPPQTAAGSWERLTSWEPPDDTEIALDPDGTAYDEALAGPIVMDEQHVPLPPFKKPRKKRSVVSQRPHVVWKDIHRQTYLDEIIRWSGRGDYIGATHCPDCLARKVESPGSPLFRCRECLSPELTCQTCCVKRHRNQPFHRIQRWADAHFEEVSLNTLGLKIQLNHSSGRCDNPIECHSKMLVLDVNGIHCVNLFYCGCTRSIPQHLQLLRRRLYPASQVSVNTCATFSLLRHLHKLALTTKASTYNFYRCLEMSTTNIGINPPKSRYRALFRMILQWRHLQMLKWAGRGNEDTGVAGTVPGELAVRCLTCPHPGINLPEGWKDVPEDQRSLYRMVVCMDANFRLKNQLVSNYSQDPGLGTGWAYMVPRINYEAYVLSRANDKDVSTCVGFQALAKANTKFSKGLRYTGVGMVSCGRSEMILPLGVGNLQKGERYANMDYIFGTILKYITVCWVLVSYDIACQWFTNLFKRMKEDWPEEIKPTDTNTPTLLPAIPKLHEQMHKESGHHVYSFKYIPGVGHTDGECPERIWAPHNVLGNATKTQGPGSRQDTLDDHFGFWNWLKYTSTGTTLLRKYRRAVEDRNSQMEAHRGLTASLPKGLERKWTRLCEEWEKDDFPKSKKNPYHSPESNLSQAEVKKSLEEAEKDFIEQGGSYPHSTTASGFIAIGLDIEETQQRLRRHAKGVTGSSGKRKENNLAEQRSLLRTRIEDWEKLLPVYIPGLIQYQLDYPDDAPDSENAEDHKLWLPSVIPQPHRLRIAHPDLMEVEGRLRYAQMVDALNTLRQILKIKSRMVQFKNKNVRGQRQGTRSRAIIDRVHERARGAAAKYRMARAAHLELGGPGEWEKTFQILKDTDIRGYQDPDHIRVRVGRRGIYEDGQAPPVDEELPADESNFVLFNEPRSRRDGTGETRRTLSWIWTGESNRADRDGVTANESNASAVDVEREEEGDGADGEKETDEDADSEENNESRDGENTSTLSKSKKADNEILRIEWSKSRARTLRATEEVVMVKEEMRRALAYLDWKAGWWKERQDARSNVSMDMLEAVASFSINQANIQTSLADHFRILWQTPLNLPAAETSNSIEDEGDDEETSEDDDEVEELIDENDQEDV